jgi:hypothetical protein
VYVNVSYRARPTLPARAEAAASAAAAPLADATAARTPDVKPVDQLAAVKTAVGAGASADSANADRTARRQRPAERRDAERGELHDARESAPAQANAIASPAEAAAAAPPAPAAARPPAAPPVPTAAPAPTAAPPPPARAEFVAPSTAADASPRAVGAAAARMMLKAQQEPPALIPSPNPNIRWQIVPGGGVQRSIDGGSTWQAQSTGVGVTLTAGAAPSPTICWLVGPGGIVLLSTDGRSWKRVAFPEATDLSSVRATDDKNATVTTADGRLFSTTDGGVTWPRSPGR